MLKQERLHARTSSSCFSLCSSAGDGNASHWGVFGRISSIWCFCFVPTDMETSLQRPLTVCLVCEYECPPQEVITSLTSIVDEEEARCVTQTSRHVCQIISLDTETAREVVIGTGLDVNDRNYARHTETSKPYQAASVRDGENAV